MRVEQLVALAVKRGWGVDVGGNAICPKCMEEQ